MRRVLHLTPARGAAHPFPGGSAAFPGVSAVNWPIRPPAVGVAPGLHLPKTRREPILPPATVGEVGWLSRSSLHLREVHRRANDPHRYLCSFLV
jgi:hypothetical protein